MFVCLAAVRASLQFFSFASVLEGARPACAVTRFARKGGPSFWRVVGKTRLIERPRQKVNQTPCDGHNQTIGEGSLFCFRNGGRSFLSAEALQEYKANGLSRWAKCRRPKQRLHGSKRLMLVPYLHANPFLFAHAVVRCGTVLSFYKCKIQRRARPFVMRQALFICGPRVPPINHDMQMQHQQQQQQQSNRTEGENLPMFLTCGSPGTTQVRIRGTKFYPNSRIAAVCTRVPCPFLITLLYFFGGFGFR